MNVRMSSDPEKFTVGGVIAVKMKMKQYKQKNSPPNISHARELIAWVYVEDILDSESCTKEITTVGVYNTLGFTSRSRSLYPKECYRKMSSRSDVQGESAEMAI